MCVRSGTSSDDSAHRLGSPFLKEFQHTFALIAFAFFQIIALLNVDHAALAVKNDEDGESEASALGAFAHRYLTEQMVAGQIQSSVQSVLRSGGVLRLSGSYVCTESIGKVKPELIGETNGKTNGENR